MPVNTHLEFAEIRDFTPGLFTISSYLMPVNGAQTMDDCRPDPGGGLRAAAKPSSFSTSGITTPANRKVCGIYARGGIGLRSGAAGDETDRYVALFNTSNQVEIWRYDGTAVSPAWTLLKTHAAVAATPNPVQFTAFVDGDGLAWVLWTLAQTSTDDGVWSVRYDTGAVVQQVSTDTDFTNAANPFVTAIATYNDRVVCAYGSTLRYSVTAPTTANMVAGNVLFGIGLIENIQRSRQGSTILSITPYAPSDLLLGTRFSPWTMVQSLVSDPFVRSMSDARTLGWAQITTTTRQGLVFVGDKAGVFLTNNGEAFEDISTQIAPDTWSSGSANNGDVGGGECAYYGNTLLAPHGLAWDERTQAWYRFSVLAPGVADHFHSWSDVNNRELFVATGGTSFSLYRIRTDEPTRASVFTWKSAPLRHPSGRRINIREVQVELEAVTTGDTVTVTVGGTARGSGSLTAGRQHVTFLFDAEAEYLDVTVLSTAAASAEAPRIESVRIGTQAGHQAY